MTVVLAYHDVSADSSPLCVSPQLFSKHLAVIAEAGANVITVSELVETLRGGATLPERTVVITFDDGLQGAVREGREILGDAGMRATFFCVAGHLGGASDWPSRARGAPVRPLADADEVRRLVAEGHEVGAHGWSHAPFSRGCDLDREIVAARERLSSVVGRDVRTIAYPYGALPGPEALRLVEQTYTGACALTGTRLRARTSPYRIPRIEAHYVADPGVLRRVVTGSLDAYLNARRLASGLRRTFRKDFAQTGPSRSRAYPLNAPHGH